MSYTSIQMQRVTIWRCPKCCYSRECKELSFSPSGIPIYPNADQPCPECERALANPPKNIVCNDCETQEDEYIGPVYETWTCGFCGKQIKDGDKLREVESK